MKKIIALTLVLVMVAGCGASTVKLGLGMVSNVKITAAGEKDGSTQVDTTACAVALDANGKIVAVSWDVTQGKAAFGTDGSAKSENASNIQTKKELGDAYGMRAVSGIGKEVGEQIVALEDYAKGKTVADITGMKTYDKGDGNHTAVPDVEELKSTCTITIGDYQAALGKAAANAK